MKGPWNLLREKPGSLARRELWRLTSPLGVMHSPKDYRVGAGGVITLRRGAGGYSLGEAANGRIECWEAGAYLRGARTCPRVVCDRCVRWTRLDLAANDSYEERAFQGQQKLTLRVEGHTPTVGWKTDVPHKIGGHDAGPYGARQPKAAGLRRWGRSEEFITNGRARKSNRACTVKTKF